MESHSHHSVSIRFYLKRTDFTIISSLPQPAPAVSIGALSALDVRTRGKRVLLSVDDDVSALS